MDRKRTFDVLAGLLAAAVALGAGEFMAGATGGTSPVIAVGNAIVDYTPGPLVHRIIDALGTRDKPTLIWSITLVSLALGASLGRWAARRRFAPEAAFAAFGLVAALATARDPLTGSAVAILEAGVAAVAGLVAFRLLVRAATPTASAPGATMPGRGAADRRRFLAFASGAAGAAAVAALAGRRAFGPSVDVEAQRDAVVLPTVTPGAAAPAATSKGFDTPGLAPLVTPNGDFYRIDTALVVPRVDASTWRLRFSGMVDHPYELGFDELLAMASVEQSAALVCVSNEVGGRLAGNAVWLGVPLPALLERAGVQSGATQVVGRSVDGFTVGFPTEVALDGRPSMVAVGMNGEPLPAEHGFPARLIVPGLYGYVSATKWLSEIELTTLEAFDAYWVPRGWAKEAPIKTQSRIDVPRNRQILNTGKRAVAGVAWGGYRGVSRVEVRIRPTEASEGEWVETRLSEALSQSSWRQWVFEWDAAPGEYFISVRATDGTGAVQTSEIHPPAPDGATGYHTIRATIRAT